MSKRPAAEGGKPQRVLQPFQRIADWLEGRPVSLRRHLWSAGGLLCFGLLGCGGGRAPSSVGVEAGIAMDVGPDSPASPPQGPDGNPIAASDEGNVWLDAAPVDEGELADALRAPDLSPNDDVSAPDDGAAADATADAPPDEGADEADLPAVVIDDGDAGTDAEAAGTAVEADSPDGVDAADPVDTADALIPDSADAPIVDTADAIVPDTADAPPDLPPDNPPPPRAPNIVLIVADDVGYSDLGAFGGEISTPNLDALAGDGRMLTNFHTGSVSAVTRSMLISGTDHHLVGLGSQPLGSDERSGLPGYEGYLNNRSLSIAELLRDAGYHTYLSGKWHLGNGIPGRTDKKGKTPDQWGFEQSYAMLSACPMNHFGHEAAGSELYAKNGAYVLPPADFYDSNYYTQQMIDFIDATRSRGDDGPFFAYVAYSTAHAPLQVPKPWFNQYDASYKDGYQPIRQARLQRMRDLGILPADAEMFPGAPIALTRKAASDNWDDPQKRKAITAIHSKADGYVDYREGYVDKQWENLSTLEKKAQSRYMQLFAGMVSNLDSNVGQLVQHLKDIGEYDRTFIMFLSDNGPEGLPFGNGDDPKATDEANAASGAYEKLGTDSGTSTAKPVVKYGMRWAEVSATPWAQAKEYPGEGGTSVPAIVHLPGQVGTQPHLKVFTHVTDVAATLLAVAGVTPPSEPAAVQPDPGAAPNQRLVRYGARSVYPITGQSLLPLLRNETTDLARAEAQFGEEIYGRASIYGQTLRWKARWTEPPFGPMDGHWELFDMDADRSETTDVSAQYPNVLKSLLSQWQTYMSRVGGVEPSYPNGYF